MINSEIIIRDLLVKSRNEPLGDNTCYEAAVRIDTLQQRNAALATSLREVIAVSDRKTDEYDRAKAALAANGGGDV